MTAPLSLAHPTTRVSWWPRQRARVAVALARPLQYLRPLRLRRTLELFRKGARPATALETQAALDAVLAASHRCRGSYCLHRSIATALLCRFGGTWPEWHTGVRTQPFKAHAWVAVDGEPVGEPQETTPYFASTMSVLPLPGKR
jgi:hypothetical protein